eukprot:TRINITY_DN4223_c0_g1_i6.p1 TRINITY_DN4223_c0_g1~~TRINITY_DN4223_c0_g1_i6.p1  ORF type:complete len:297 (-),score=44.71 TRINITY_DN4223_c0_g1_i6:104-952(-)
MAYKIRIQKKDGRRTTSLNGYRLDTSKQNGLTDKELIKFLTRIILRVTRPLISREDIEKISYQLKHPWEKDKKEKKPAAPTINVLHAAPYLPALPAAPTLVADWDGNIAFYDEEKFNKIKEDHERAPEAAKELQDAHATHTSIGRLLTIEAMNGDQLGRLYKRVFDESLNPTGKGKLSKKQMMSKFESYLSLDDFYHSAGIEKTTPKEEAAKVFMYLQEQAEDVARRHRTADIDNVDGQDQNETQGASVARCRLIGSCLQSGERTITPSSSTRCEPTTLPIK